MIQGFSLGRYVKLVELTSRLIRLGKAAITAELARILERQIWCGQFRQSWIESRSDDTLLGRFYASTSAKLWEIDERRAVRDSVNLTSCPAR